MKTLGVLIVALIICPRAFSQIQHGTVGVFYLSEDKIIIAADSRVTMRNGSPPDDTICKIAAFNEQVVFFSAHAVGYVARPGDFVSSWNSIDIAREAFQVSSLLYPRNSARILGTAEQWAMNMTFQFESLLAWRPDELRDIAGKTGGLAIALIGGVDADGTPVLFDTQIDLIDGPVPRIVHNTVRILRCPTVFCAIAEPEIAYEFIEGKTERAQAEAKNWKLSKYTDPSEVDALKAMRLVVLSERFNGAKIGGSVDAFEIDRGGSGRWVAVKSNCGKD